MWKKRNKSIMKIDGINPDRNMNTKLDNHNSSVVLLSKSVSI